MFRVKSVFKGSSSLGYAIYARGVKQCVGEIVGHLNSVAQKPMWLACINPHSFVIGMQSPKFNQALKNADWLVPDGVGIVLAQRIIDRHKIERVTGSDIFLGVMCHLNDVGGKVFFMGSTWSNLEVVSMRVRLDYPNIKIVGVHSPPFKDEFSAEDIDCMVGKINVAAPDVLWLGLTSPKQDLWINDNVQQLNIKFAAGIGAVFDYYSGKIKRPHLLFRQTGLEWLPRLFREPQRLWRRMFISAPIFIFYVVKIALGLRV
jgi:N-acetylglucosaminyldiphosphoundecaprenol N-acetyl-beta-D-mannosaminyltransferase